jgi:hypothetical protein
MSPRAGGDAASRGPVYESECGAEALLDVLAGRQATVRFESPEDPDGIEFRTTDDRGSETFHQVKRQRAAGEWRIADLADVLATFFGCLQGVPDARCVFTSQESAGQLRELVERSQSTEDVAAFRRSIASQRQDGRWERVQLAFGAQVSEEDALDVLRRIRVEAVSEHRLRLTNELRAAAVLTGHPASAVDFLNRLALTSRAVLDEAAVLRELASRGIERRRASPQEASSALLQADVYAGALRSARLVDFRLPRREADAVASRLQSGDVVLTGAPGAGKSTAVEQVVERLKAFGTTVLPLHLDRVEPTRSTRDLGRQLGFDTSPVIALARLADRGTGVLVIDQLDAVSIVSGRRAQMLEVVAGLLDEADQFPDVHVLLACREFDFDHDPRIRTMSRDAGVERVRLTPPTQEEVRAALAAQGVDVERLSGAQIEALRSPLLLAVFLEVVDREGAYEFADGRELFGLLWDAGTEEAGAAEWLAIVSALSEHMSAMSTLVAPRPLVDRWPAAVRRLLGLGVLTRDGETLAFFHEAFFDYAYARQFVASGRRLSDVLGIDQLLFRRAQVRQILEYQRAAQLPAYVDALNDVLHDPDMRVHLKAAVLSQLAGRNDPREEELDVIAPLLDDPSSPVHARAWGVLHGGGWPQLLDGLGRLEEWLGDERYVVGAIEILHVSKERLRDRVAALLEPLLADGERGRTRIYRVLQLGELHHDRSLFDLYLRLMDDGFFDASDHRVWTDLAELPDERPTWATEFLGRFYRRRLGHETNPFEEERRNDGPDEHFARAVAERAPHETLGALLDVVIEAAHRTVTRGGNLPRRDRIWMHRDDDRHAPSEVVLLAVELALATVARSGSEALQPYVSRLQSTDLEVAQYLLYVAWAADARFADAALRYVIEAPHRVEASISFDDFWQTRLLVAAATPVCSEETLRRFERFLLGDAIDADAQFTLLPAIAAERIGPEAQRRLDELQVQHGATDVAGPEMFQSGSIRSPIELDEARRLDEAGWLAAVARFRDDRRDPHRPLVGGAEQLARVLDQVTRQDPNRLARIASHFPDGTNPIYFEAVLLGLGQSDEPLDRDAVVEFCERCHRLPGRPCGRFMGDPLERLAEDEIPNDLLDALAWYATDDPDPRPGSPRAVATRELTTAGINTVRGAATRVIGNLIAKRQQRLERLKPAIEAVARDPSLSVRSCAVYPLWPALRRDPQWAIAVLRAMLATDDEILASRLVERLIGYAAIHELRPMLEVVARMLRSEIDEVRGAGARRAGVLALDHLEARELLADALGGDAGMRRGIAGVFAHNLATAGHREMCEAGLRRLFEDEDEDVRKQAGDCFRHVPDDALGQHETLVRMFLRSRAFPDAASVLLLACRASTMSIPALTVDVCETWLDRLDEIVAKRDGPLGHDALEVAELGVRAYTQAPPDGDLQERALDVIDRLIAENALGVDRALAVAEADR